MNLSTIDSVQLLHDNLLVTRQNLNDFFITVSAILVFGNIFIILYIFYFIARFNCKLIWKLAMQAGFSLMETGLVRSKNATNILMKSTLDACESIFKVLL